MTFITTAPSPHGVPLTTMIALMLAVFTVSMGYGVVLPLLPYLIERLIGAGSDITQVSRSTGLLTAIYTLALFLFAPIWGRMSDLYGRRIILLAGLVGFGVTMLIFTFMENFVGLYAERFLSGLFAAAVTPVALAVVADLATSEEERARRLTFVSLAGISGFLLGPMLGVFLARTASSFLQNPGASGTLVIPLAATSVLALFVAVAVAMTVSGTKPTEALLKTDPHPTEIDAWLMPRLLALAFIVSAGVGVFEVGLALRGKQELGLTQYQIATMFSECSLVMFVVQAIVFSPWVKPETTRWMIAPAMALLATGLFLVLYASDFRLMLVVVGAIAASAGILSPILSYWISNKAGKAQGASFGKQTAASSLGVTAGSAAGGLLFEIPQLPNASFILLTLLTVFGFFLSLGLPNLLLTQRAKQAIPLNQT
jgi:MFS family permease